MGGVVSYTDTVKHRVLGVPAEMLEEYGAVSAPVARAMAEGVRKVTTADLAVSVTGVAGPERARADRQRHGERSGDGGLPRRYYAVPHFHGA